MPALHYTTWLLTPSPKVCCASFEVLIKPKDPKFLPAFYKAVGNTFVADDLEQSNRIAFGTAKRWRVVTLAGQLIDASGTMSGGRTDARGAMSSKLAADAVRLEVLRQFEQ